jgi:EAL domain-containing protein (putative c-di-GMP-specific phosphodiesterase class I)
MMSDPKQTTKLLGEFHSMGVKVSIDDFGSGYSSLSYLTDLHVNELKIDRSFISSMNTSAKHHAIVKSIIGIADNLGIKVVAEGVETLEQYNMVKEMGCYATQGFFISRSIPESEVENWLDTGEWPIVSAL